MFDKKEFTVHMTPESENRVYVTRNTTGVTCWVDMDLFSGDDPERFNKGFQKVLHKINQQEKMIALFKNALEKKDE